MSDTEGIWANVPGAEIEDAELALAAEQERLRENRIKSEARMQIERHEGRERAKRAIAEMAALERGPFASRVHNMAGVRELQMPKHLMRHVLYTGSVAVVLGDSQVGKSWVLQAIACCAASGVTWPDMLPNSKGKLGVLYIAAEDGGAIKLRLEHWERAHTRTIPDETFHAYPEPVDLLDDVAVEEIIEFVKGHQIRLVIVDTISASLGGQEETNENFAKLVRNGRRIAKAMAPHGGGSVAFAHHFGKDKEKGGRGGSSLFNDCDIVWELTGDIHNIEFTNRKWKVDEKRHPRRLRLDASDRNAVHITEYRGSGGSTDIPEDPNTALERGILAIIQEFATQRVNQGFGISGSDIRGKLPERGIHARTQDITDKLAAMVLDRKLVRTQRGAARLYQLPPAQTGIDEEA